LLVEDEGEREERMRKTRELAKIVWTAVPPEDL
jgi:hypothetical protein